MGTLYLETLANYYLSTRRAGHTTAAIYGVGNVKDAKLIIGTWGQKKYIDMPPEKMIVVDDMNLSLRGSHLPVVLDNFAVDIMWGQVKKELMDKDEELKKLRKRRFSDEYCCECFKEK